MQHSLSPRHYVNIYSLICFSYFVEVSNPTFPTKHLTGPWVTVIFENANHLFDSLGSQSSRKLNGISIQPCVLWSRCNQGIFQSWSLVSCLQKTKMPISMLRMAKELTIDIFRQIIRRMKIIGKTWIIAWCKRLNYMKMLNMLETLSKRIFKYLSYFFLSISWLNEK